MIWGIILVVLGGVFLLQNLGLFSGEIWNYFWPIILVVIGAWLIIKDKKRGIGMTCKCGKGNCPECGPKMKNEHKNNGAKDMKA